MIYEINIHDDDNDDEINENLVKKNLVIFTDSKHTCTKISFKKQIYNRSASRSKQ